MTLSAKLFGNLMCYSRVMIFSKFSLATFVHIPRSLCFLKGEILFESSGNPVLLF